MAADVSSKSAEAPRSGSRVLARLVPAGLVVCALILVALVAWMPTPENTLEPPASVPVNVKTWTVEAVPELADTFDVSAVVEPNAVIRVAAEVAGRVERFASRARAVRWRGRLIAAERTIDEGEPVEAGAPLIYLNPELLQARYDRAKSQHAYDAREYERIRRLFERGTTSKTELDDALTRLEMSKAALDEAEEELERTTIVAPISGILNRLPIEVGEYAAPGQQVAEIVDIDTVKIVVHVPERDVHFLSVGDTAQIMFRAPDERQLAGRITYLSELAETQARTTRCEIAVANADHTLRSGQIVKVRLTRRVLEDVVMIPLSAVIPLEIGRVVYVVNDGGLAERRDVSLGFIRRRSVRVLAGLTPGDRLIVTGHRYVGPDQAVNVVEELSLEP
jgi:membrane fusion protein (multidrug efflux system)